MKIAIIALVVSIASCAGRAAEPEARPTGRRDAPAEAGTETADALARAPSGRSAEEERRIAALLERLNQWCASYPDECDASERPEAHPGRVSSGETNGWIADCREQLDALGVRVRFDPSRRRYERVEAAREPPAAAGAGSKEARRAPERRCLPVVAAECGCVYSCGAGERRPDGRWTVTHPHWAPAPLTARVDRWCVDGRCTEAFFGEIVCSDICAPRPADPTCRFEADRCVGAQGSP